MEAKKAADANDGNRGGGDAWTAAVGCCQCHWTVTDEGDGGGGGGKGVGVAGRGDASTATVAAVCVG